MSDYLNGIKGWWKRPYHPDMSVTDWFALAGMALCIMILWQVILAHITREF